MDELIKYIEKAMSGLKPLAGIIIAGISYIMFPEQAYATAALALGGAIIMDIFSKHVAISAKNGGFRKAFKTGKIFSRSLWEGTKIKLLTYLSISIMVGLSYRLNALPNSFAAISKFMATVVYTVLFIREFLSMLENFRDAGAKNIDWLIIWSRDKEKEILKKENIQEDVKEQSQDKINGDDYNKYLWKEELDVISY